MKVIKADIEIFDRNPKEIIADALRFVETKIPKVVAIELVFNPYWIWASRRIKREYMDEVMNIEIRRTGTIGGLFGMTIKQDSELDQNIFKIKTDIAEFIFQMVPFIKGSTTVKELAQIE